MERTIFAGLAVRCAPGNLRGVTQCSVDGPVCCCVILTSCSGSSDNTQQGHSNRFQRLSITPCSYAGRLKKVGPVSNLNVVTLVCQCVCVCVLFENETAKRADVIEEETHI